MAARSRLTPGIALAAAVALGTAAAILLLWRAEPAGAPRVAVPACAGIRAVDLGCQLRRYEAIVRRSGVDAAFAALKRASARRGYVRAACHPIVHAIGHAAVDRLGRDFGRVFARGDPFCSAGYYHGVTERFVSDMGRRRFTTEADGLCARLGGHARRSIHHRNCAHGVGHGFMLALDGDLSAALETCDLLADSWERRSCYGGVFMENVMALGTSRHLRPMQPLHPCGGLARRYRAMCYQKQTGYALYVRDGDAGAVFALCDRVDRPFRRPCFEGAGTSIAVHHLKQVSRPVDRRRLTVGTCALAPRRAATAACVAGAVRALINYDHDTRQARALCGAAPSRLRPGCRRTVAAKRTYPE